MNMNLTPSVGPTDLIFTKLILHHVGKLSYKFEFSDSVKDSKIFPKTDVKGIFPIVTLRDPPRVPTRS
jgi:hypothetical protein